MINHEDVVRAAYDEQPAEKTVIGALAFLMRVIRKLQQRFPDETVGLLRKTAGENIVLYGDSTVSASRITYPDTNEMYKVLTDVPGTNGPSWQQDSPIPTGGAYGEGYVAVAVEPVTPVEPVPVPTVDLSAVLAKLDALALQADANTEKIQQQIDTVVKNAERSAALLVPLLLKGKP